MPRRSLCGSRAIGEVMNLLPMIRYFSHGPGSVSGRRAPGRGGPHPRRGARPRRLPALVVRRGVFGARAHRLSPWGRGAMRGVPPRERRAGPPPRSSAAGSACDGASFAKGASSSTWKRRYEPGRRGRRARFREALRSSWKASKASRKGRPLPGRGGIFREGLAASRKGWPLPGRDGLFREGVGSSGKAPALPGSDDLFQEDADPSGNAPILPRRAGLFHSSAPR